MQQLATESLAGPQFQLSEEQEMLVRMTRDFVADNIIPVAAEYDAQAIFPKTYSIKRANSASSICSFLKNTAGWARAALKKRWYRKS